MCWRDICQKYYIFNDCQFNAKLYSTCARQQFRCYSKRAEDRIGVLFARFLGTIRAKMMGVVRCKIECFGEIVINKEFSTTSYMFLFSFPKIFI